jgi:hypothetical protein
MMRIMVSDDWMIYSIASWEYFHHRFYFKLEVLLAATNASAK